MEQDFQYDVFLSHSAKDKAVVRPLAARLRADGLNPCVSEILHSAFTLLPSPSAPIKGSLAQFVYINWLIKDREQELWGATAGFSPQRQKLTGLKEELHG